MKKTLDNELAEIFKDLKRKGAREKSEVIKSLFNKIREDINASTKDWVLVFHSLFTIFLKYYINSYLDKNEKNIFLEIGVKEAFKVNFPQLNETLESNLSDLDNKQSMIFLMDIINNPGFKPYKPVLLEPLTEMVELLLSEKDNVSNNVFMSSGEILVAFTQMGNKYDVVRNGEVAELKFNVKKILIEMLERGGVALFDGIAKVNDKNSTKQNTELLIRDDKKGFGIASLEIMRFFEVFKNGSEETSEKDRAILLKIIKDLEKSLPSIFKVYQESEKDYVKNNLVLFFKDLSILLKTIITSEFMSKKDLSEMIFQESLESKVIKKTENSISLDCNQAKQIMHFESLLLDKLSYAKNGDVVLLSFKDMLIKAIEKFKENTHNEINKYGCWKVLEKASNQEGEESTMIGLKFEVKEDFPYKQDLIQLMEKFFNGILNDSKGTEKICEELRVYFNEFLMIKDLKETGFEVTNIQRKVKF